MIKFKHTPASEKEEQKGLSLRDAAELTLCPVLYAARKTTSCELEVHFSQKGARDGAAAGAAIGASVGGAKGAAIGAVFGGVAGGVLGPKDEGQ